MPIRVACPGCAAVVSAPDAKAGKIVNCPKCSTKMALPGGGGEYDLVDEPAPKPSRPVINVRDDDSGEFETRPRKKKKVEAPAKSNTGLFALIAFFLFLILIAIVVLIWVLLPKKTPVEKPNVPPPVTAPETPKTTWTEFKAPDGSFSAMFPNGAPQANATPNVALPNIPQMGGAKNASDLGIDMGHWVRNDASGVYTVQYLSLPEIMINSMPQLNALNNVNVGKQNDGTEVTVAEPFKIGEHTGRRVVQKNANRILETRMIKVKSRVFTIISQTTTDTDPAIAKYFFEKFAILNVPDAKPLPGLEGFGGNFDDLLKQFPDANKKN